MFAVACMQRTTSVAYRTGSVVVMRGEAGAYRRTTSRLMKNILRLLPSYHFEPITLCEIEPLAVTGCHRTRQSLPQPEPVPHRFMRDDHNAGCKTP